MNKSPLSTQDISCISLCTVFFILCSWICIPTPIPFTMQNFGIIFATLVIGKKRTFYSVLIYFLAGLIGFPVFSGFRSGISVLTGPTGGYAIAMLFFPIIIAGNTSDEGKKYFTAAAISTTLATIFLYVFGTVWYMLFYANDSLLPILSICVFPFLVPDAIKCTLAVIFAKKFKKHLLRH